MKYETMTKLKTPTDKQAADVLLYTKRCVEAIKKIPAPKGVSVSITIKASDKKQDKVVKKAGEIMAAIAKEIEKAEAATDRASRKSAK